MPRGALTPGVTQRAGREVSLSGPSASQGLNWDRQVGGRQPLDPAGTAGQGVGTGQPTESQGHTRWLRLDQDSACCGPGRRGQGTAGPSREGLAPVRGQRPRRHVCAASWVQGQWLVARRLRAELGPGPQGPGRAGPGSLGSGWHPGAETLAE